jgi:hypothetical protein
MRQTLSLVSRIVGLAVVLFVALSVAAVISGVAQPAPGPSQESHAGPPPADASLALVATVLFSVLVAAVFSWMVLRSGLVGWRLAGAVFLAYFGLGTFLPQIESAVFLPRHLPPGFVTRLFVMGAVTGLCFAPAAVWFLGRRKGAAIPEASSALVRLRSRGGILRIAGLSLAYVALYFLAGYYIAYRNPELVAYYDDSHPGSFVAGLRQVWAAAPWLFALQALRGALWVAVVLPFIVSFRGRRFELSVLIGCAHSVWAVMLLAPNPYMPETVRMTHLFEIASSNFLFGGLVGATLAPARGNEFTPAERAGGFGGTRRSAPRSIRE